MTTAPFLVIAGPTASGKSQLAMSIAEACNGELVCCDSVQLYQGFEIGTAAPSAADQARVPHQLFGSVRWDATYDAFRFAADARRVIQDIQGRERLPIVVGGTGLYLRALIGPAFHEQLPSDEDLRRRLAKRSTAELAKLLRRLDPDRAAELHVHDRVRLLRSLEIRVSSGQPFHELTEVKGEQDPAAHVVIVAPDRAHLHTVINQRSQEMLAQGLVQEVQGLLTQGVSKDCKPMQSIGYRQVVQFLADEFEQSELGDRIAAATRQYAKRQDTWFRKVQATLRVLGPIEIDRVVDLAKTLATR